ncbi:MAG TPA: helix-turn-helix transcriptional regulator [Mycobacteriales bacterium]|jgi:transcriptional regulator with XRE-family HTH domain|nr:helix-turn-helix transcriptional regulator [Mycobacteriales bacterium]
MEDTAKLGAFLKARRAALDPDELGLVSGVNRRRVAGLRREELAQLAAISVDYYTRLEQGRARNVSTEVLDSLARALQLTADEHRYLRNLAAAPKHRRATPPRPQRVRPELRMMLDAITTPALIFGRNLDVLAYNALGAVMSFHLPTIPVEERNMARLFFLDDSAAELHPEWDSLSREVVANLRSEAGRHPDDPRLAQLIGELSLRSEEFRRLWAGHAVREKAHGVKRIRNPIVGDMSLRYETLRLADDPDQALLIYTAEPGSDSDRALRLLASWVADEPQSVSR